MSRRPLEILLVAFVFVSAAPPVEAQRVLLQINPHVGDTLSVRMDQRVEMSGAPADCVASAGGSDRAARSGIKPSLCSASTRQMTTVTEVFSRAIVRGVSSEGASVLAITDSIRTAAARGGRPGAPRRVRGSDKVVNLRLSKDGGAEITDADASAEIRAIFGQMPATLSKKPVSVGETWKREMRIPVAAEDGGTGLVRATFRLDSLGSNGDVAHISMRGTLSHDHRDGSDSDVDGSMNGTIELDRRLGWIIESRANIDVISRVKASANSAAMRVRTKITQLLRAGPVR
jgi:hypothetical protein